MKTNTIRIVAAVVDTRQLTLYKEDGNTIFIPQEDPRLRRIIDEAAPLLVSQGYADICIEAVEDNSYAQFEEQTNGVVKLFRIAKSRLANLFSSKPREEDPPVMSAIIGSVPGPATIHINTAGVYDVLEEDEVAAAAEAPPALVTHMQQTLAAVNEIMQHAVPVSSADFHEKSVAQQGNVVEKSGDTISKHDEDTDATDTIIAVVGDKIIPGMEKIKTQFARAAKMGSTIGVENFLKRIAAVIDQRSHSVEDLLKFMERGDLPIADDGSILIYKVLRRSNGQKYVDCHTNKVEQWVGAYVCMDPSLVDQDRRNECSNGLHVARRGYIKNFSGDVCVLAKLAPEDVIAVPSYDANKMRVCGYHIIMELAPEQYNELKANRAITSTEAGKALLARALGGRHTAKTHEVRIKGQQGADVVVTDLGKTTAPVFQKKETTPTVFTAPVQAEALANPGEEMLDKPTDPKDVVQQVEQLSRKQIAAQLYANYQAGLKDSLELLMAYKKAAKVGWEKLGIPDPTASPAVKVALGGKPKAQAKKVPEVVATVSPAKTTLHPGPVPSKAAFPNAPVFPKRVVNGVVLGEGSYRERIQKLLSIGLTSVGVADAILSLKKQSKKSWTVLGVSDAQVEQIQKLAGM